MDRVGDDIEVGGKRFRGGGSFATEHHRHLHR
jgi:hypothetical protein